RGIGESWQNFDQARSRTIQGTLLGGIYTSGHLMNLDCWRLRDRGLLRQVAGTAGFSSEWEKGAAKPRPAPASLVTPRPFFRGVVGRRQPLDFRFGRRWVFLEGYAVRKTR